MKQLIGLLFMYLSFSALTYGQVQVYQLQQKTENARINPHSFKKLALDQLRTTQELKNAFAQSLKGKHEVYFFIATYQGHSFDGTQKTFHDYLVIQVDPKTQIIEDGYQYTLEWTDSPRIDLYRIHHKSTKLQNGLKIDALDFRCFYVDPEDTRYRLNDRQSYLSLP